MVESLCATLFPVLWLIFLFRGGVLFRRRQIDIDGEPPIDRKLFYASKYAIIIPWTAMILQSWGVNLSFMSVPGTLRRVSLGIWASGFVLLFIGRLGLGDSFRFGSAKESTDLRVTGLFRFSRNPLYLAMYSTLLAPVLYTLNPIPFLAGIFVVTVHHRIVLAEEQHLRQVFGEQYLAYCRAVRRYL